MELLEKFNIVPNDPELFEIAFIHKSYKVQHNLPHDYERLEFLGDSVLSLAVSEYIYKKHCHDEEGSLTKTRSNFVCEYALDYYSSYLGLDSYLKIAEDNLTINEIKSANADIVESFLGALFLDQGIEKVREFLKEHIFKFIDLNVIFFRDYKSQIKEYGDAKELNIHYELVKEEGFQHDRTFLMEILINDKVMGEGYGKNKKEAEQEAAKVAIRKLGLNKK
ncbi:ribonuclease III [Methanobrevibacter curvatus]|uniref:ribonuclease III n=1 Tax=Methanobrevibacter curvatus TaxID=49547 RepID=A0A162FET2_9EURY|nr:ribonuclease III [Methanobrevibacter curvatus]KZX12005.1 ribonuclease 3 [Methanobrevibacter curvatus]